MKNTERTQKTLNKLITKKKKKDVLTHIEVDWLFRSIQLPEFQTMMPFVREKWLVKTSFKKKKKRTFHHWIAAKHPSTASQFNPG